MAPMLSPPPPPPYRRPVSPDELHPSRLWYLLAGALLVAGLVTGGVIFIRGILGLSAGLQRVPVPGTHDVQLEGSRHYFIYSEIDDRSRFVQPPELSCTLRDANEVAVSLGRPSGEFTYATSGGRGRAIYSFTSGPAGTYRLSCTSRAGDASARAAVGPSIFRGIFRLAALAGACVVGAVAIALPLSLVVFIRRDRLRRTLQRQPLPAPAQS